jgi:hypothetical protein
MTLRHQDSLATPRYGYSYSKAYPVSSFWVDAAGQQAACNFLSLSVGALDSTSNWLLLGEATANNKLASTELGLLLLTTHCGCYLT